MNKFRNSGIMRLMCFIMAFSIFVISCDRNGDLTTNKSIDNQADNILQNYPGAMSPEDCAAFRESIEAVKTYIWAQRSNGIYPTRGDIANFVYERSVSNGTIASDPNLKKALSDLFMNNSWNGDNGSIINRLAEEQMISSQMAGVLHQFKTDFSNVASYAEGYSTINSMRHSPILNNLTEQEQSIIQTAFDAAENTICDAEASSNELQIRDLCEECSWVMHWEMLVISIVITVVAFLIIWLSFGLASGWAATITITVWASVWYLHCIWVDCPDSEICPEGQSPKCEGSFVFDQSIPACVHEQFAPGDYSWNGCIYSPVVNGGCPEGSTKNGQSCLWECSDNDVPVKNSKGQWQLPYHCQ